MTAIVNWKTNTTTVSAANYGSGTGGSAINSWAYTSYGGGSGGVAYTSAYATNISGWNTAGTNEYVRSYPSSCSKCNSYVPHIYNSLYLYKLENNKLTCNMCCVLDDLKKCLDEPTEAPEKPKATEEVKNNRLAGMSLTPKPETDEEIKRAYIRDQKIAEEIEHWNNNYIQNYYSYSPSIYK